jgi:rod shape-determining protein MreC
VKSSQDVRLIRVWSVTAVTPVAKVLEVVRRNTIGLVEDYFVLINVREENRKLSSELGNLKMENHFLKSELQTAERAQALIAFKARTPSRTIPARIIGTGTGTNSRVVYVDQGSSAGIMRGMAVVTPDGIVGKVLDAYPTASQVMLITDPTFRAGVTSEKNWVNGTVEGQGQNKLRVNYVENEEKVDTGEIFYTSGDDRIFPRGMPVGKATVVRAGKNFKEIYVVPTGFQNGLEEVLIVVKGEHQPIPDRSEAVTSNNIYLLDPPKASAAPAAAPSVLSTDADRLREQYKEVGAAQGHEFGEGGPGSRPPNFNLRVEAPKPPASSTPTAGAGGAAAARVQTNPIAVPPKPKPPVATGGISETNPPAKPRPVTIGPEGQPIPSRPKPTAPITVNSGPAPAPPPVSAPAKRVTTNDSTINIVTPAPKSANPAPAKPKPQQTESSPNP